MKNEKKVKNYNAKFKIFNFSLLNFNFPS